MQTIRPAFATDPRRFGRRAMALIGELPRQASGWSPLADVRLFATTFLAGFLFVSILIG